MSELPDLPDVVRRRRPLPPGGVEAAMASGARKRNRVLAAAGGTTTALVAALALTVNLPGGGSDSLGIAERPDAAPSVTVPADELMPDTDEPAEVPPTAAPTTDPTADPTVDVPAPPAGGSGPAPVAPKPTTGPRPADNGAQSGPATDPTQPPAAAPAPSRPAYREDTDEDAPGTGVCSGRAPGSSCVHGRNSGSIARRGEQVTLTHLECSGTGIADTLYSFAGGQEKEVVVTRDSQEVFRFSSTVRYVEGAHQRRLRSGRCIEWTGRWDQVTTQGQPVPAGTYEVTLTVEAERAEPEGVPQEGTTPYRQSGSFDVTIVD